MKRKKCGHKSAAIQFLSVWNYRKYCFIINIIISVWKRDLFSVHPSAPMGSLFMRKLIESSGEVVPYCKFHNLCKNVYLFSLNERFISWCGWSKCDRLLLHCIVVLLCPFVSAACLLMWMYGRLCSCVCVCVYALQICLGHIMPLWSASTKYLYTWAQKHPQERLPEPDNLVRSPYWMKLWRRGGLHFI